MNDIEIVQALKRIEDKIFHLGASRIRVLIIKCSVATYWYNGDIGTIFEVYEDEDARNLLPFGMLLNDGSINYYVADDIDRYLNSKIAVRMIDERDCEVI